MQRINLALNLFKVIDSIRSEDLLFMYVKQATDFHSINHPKYGVSKSNQIEYTKKAKESLRWLTDNGYLEMKMVDGEWHSFATQKIHDEDPVPIGFKKRILNKN